MKLHYLVEGDPKITKQWIPGVPASDYDEPDVDVAAERIASGLYEEDVMAGEPDRTQNEVMPLITEGQEPTEAAKAAEGQVTGPMTDETRHAAENAPTPHGPVDTEQDDMPAAVDTEVDDRANDELPVPDRDLGPATAPTAAEGDALAGAEHSDNPEIMDGTAGPFGEPVQPVDFNSTP